MSRLKYGGPYRPKKTRKNFQFSLKKLKIFKSKFFITCFLSVVLAGGFFYWLFCSNNFKIGQIEIIGNQQVSRDEIMNVAQNLLSKKKAAFLINNNYWLFSEDDLADRLTNNFNAIENSEVQKSFPHKIKIVIKERSAALIYCQFDKDLNKKDSVPKCYLVDKNGMAFRESAFIEGGDMPMIEDWSGYNKVLGSYVVSDSTIKKIIQIKDDLPSILNIKPMAFVVSEDHRLDAVLEGGWRIYFDPEKEISAQLGVLKRLFDQEISNKLSTIQYVDLRVDGRIYYK